MRQPAGRDGGPAFPRPEVMRAPGLTQDSAVPGMSLRDYFAGQAFGYLNLIRAETLTDVAKAKGQDVIEVLAITLYQIADAMLKERAK